MDMISLLAATKSRPHPPTLDVWCMLLALNLHPLMSPTQVTKRLSDKEVQEIFSCLYEPGKRPPPHLSFQIVPVGPNGLKLSPPSHEFEDGLYVLLRPLAKKKNAPVPMPPPHLRDLVMPTVPPENCAWSLSGPQFPVKHVAGSLQQRYCYPKGRPEYSSSKGGALWTIRGQDGKEDNEFRLLHVYESQKRAANKGVVLPPRATPSSFDYSCYPPAPKKPCHISPSRERVFSLAHNKAIPPNNIHRINSCATLDSAMSFSSLDQCFSHSFESAQMGAPTDHTHHSNQPSPDQLSSRDVSVDPQDQHLQYSSARQEHHSAHEFHFTDLHNDPLLREMDQRSHHIRLHRRLGIIHDKIRTYIFKHPPHLQSALVCSVSEWARAVAMDPMGPHGCSPANEDPDRDAFGPDHEHRKCC